MYNKSSTRKIQFYKSSISLGFIIIFGSSFLLLSPKAQATKSITSVDSLLFKNKLLVQAFEDDRCPEKYVYLLGSTKNYKVTICGTRTGGTPTHYLADSKNGSGNIFVPLSSYTESRFVARNGKYTYTVVIDKGGNGSGRLIIKVPGKRPQIQKFEMEIP
jgi:hypothetical protein